MDKEYLIQLVKNAYGLTLLFPKKDPLRYKVRELANEILESLIPGTKKLDVCFEKLEILDSFFEVAKSQNWVSLQDILKVQEEYNKLKEVLKWPEVPENQPKFVFEPPAVREDAFVSVKDHLQNRQGKIMTLLKENNGIQVWQAKKVFPEVSKRTLRRDFENMLKQGLIERVGEKNDTFYKIKTNIV